MGKTKAVNLVIPLTKMGKRKRRRSGVDDSTRRVYLLFIKGVLYVTRRSPDESIVRGSIEARLQGANQDHDGRGRIPDDQVQGYIRNVYRRRCRRMDAGSSYVTQ